MEDKQEDIMDPRIKQLTTRMNNLEKRIKLVNTLMDMYEYNCQSIDNLLLRAKRFINIKNILESCEPKICYQPSKQPDEPSTSQPSAGGSQ